MNFLSEIPVKTSSHHWSYPLAGPTAVYSDGVDYKYKQNTQENTLFIPTHSALVLGNNMDIKYLNAINIIPNVKLICVTDVRNAKLVGRKTPIWLVVRGFNFIDSASVQLFRKYVNQIRLVVTEGELDDIDSFPYVIKTNLPEIELTADSPFCSILVMALQGIRHIFVHGFESNAIENLKTTNCYKLLMRDFPTLKITSF